MRSARFSTLFALSLLLSVSTFAQPERADPNGRLFTEIDFPSPTENRRPDGKPSGTYWQQEADYQIEVELDTAQNRVIGTQTITYANNAPVDLDYLWIQLDQNYYRPGSKGDVVRLKPKVRGSKAYEKAFSEAFGYDLSDLRVVRGREERRPEYLIDDTRMRIELEDPLPANGGTLQVALDFAFKLSAHVGKLGHVDLQQGNLFQIAQWYPRMHVYDDIRRWNTRPYLGEGEYYLEYGNFDVHITVPHEMVVAATGALQNPEEILTKTQRTRLHRAKNRAEPVAIIDSSEVGTSAARPEGSESLTWKYKAEQMRDFAWAASEAFLWDAAKAETGEQAVVAHSLYPKEGIGSENKPGWESSIQFVQHAVEYYSEFIEPYPYQRAISVAGPVGGWSTRRLLLRTFDIEGAISSE